MGTSSTIMFATLYYAFHERISILPNFHNALILYCQYIDDIFGIWIGTTTNWEHFQHTLDQCGNLRWKASKLSTLATFLDIIVKINPATRWLETNSYFKPMNLFLYIPPNSAHPLGCLKGIIYGQLRRFWLQNSSQSAYIHAIHHFFQKLMSRGHSRLFLSKIFLESARKLDLKSKSNSKKYLDKVVIFHCKYHPHGIPKHGI